MGLTQFPDPVLGNGHRKSPLGLWTRPVLRWLVGEAVEMPPLPGIWQMPYTSPPQVPFLERTDTPLWPSSTLLSAQPLWEASAHSCTTTTDR